MGYNDEINNRIRDAINEVKETLILCKATDDPCVVTYDGIISIGDTTPELLFLLKEPNDGRARKNSKTPDFEEGFDFVKNARLEAIEQNEKKPEHWDNLCYWTKAYHDIQQGKKSYFNHPSVVKCGGMLGEIAIVNIKKVPGAGSTNHNDFLKTVENKVCSKLIRDEIEWISPKIVVCCGTYDYAKIIYDGKQIKEKILECGLRIFSYKKICFLEFVHPTQYGLAARSGLLYVYAKEAFNNLQDVGE